MSPIGKLTQNDFVKGAFLFVASAVLTTLISALQAGSVDWGQVGMVAIISFLSYLSKQIATDENGKLGGKF